MANYRKPYHLLLLQHDDGAFYIEFGAYDKQDVKDESENMRAHYKAKQLAIVTARTAKQVDCNEACAEFNAKRNR